MELIFFTAPGRIRSPTITHLIYNPSHLDPRQQDRCTALTPAELPPTDPSPGESASAPPDHTQIKWVLSSEALEKLLNCFSPDRDEAGKSYELMRLKLSRFFDCRACNSPEDLVDEAINRVARRINEGEIIFNLKAYFFKVAHLVFLEYRRDLGKMSVTLGEIPEPLADSPSEDEEKEARLRCLDVCLEKLTIQNRTLILKYYQEERRAKIDHRKQLAEFLGIPLNALRIRAHRIRGFLEKCARDCLAQTVPSRNQTGFSAL